jgi:hypothetical protein
MKAVHRWRKSSRSHNSGACVELSHTLAAVRDSKFPAGPALDVNVRGLLAMVKSDGGLRSNRT